MKLSALQTFGVGGVRDGVYRFANPTGTPLPLVCITGPRGSGKTSLLRAIVAAKEGISPYVARPAESDVIASTAESARLVTEWVLDAEEQRFAGLQSPLVRGEAIYARGRLGTSEADPGLSALLERYSHDRDSFKLEYYAEDRSLPSYLSSATDLLWEQKRNRLSEGSQKYAGSLRFARDAVLGIRGGERRAELEALFRQLCPEVTVAGVDGSGVLEFARRDGARLPLHRLSSGQRAALLFAATSVMVGYGRAVILVDQPELAALGDAPRFLSVLMAHAPESQWIVATSQANVTDLAPAEGQMRLS